MWAVATYSSVATNSLALLGTVAVAWPVMIGVGGLLLLAAGLNYSEKMQIGAVALTGRMRIDANGRHGRG